MSLFLIDLAIAIVFVGFFVYVMATDSGGFFSVLIPYAGAYYVTVVAPIVMTVVNLIVSLFTNYSALQAIIPLVLPIVVLSYRKIRDKLNESFWVNHIEPIKEDITSYLASHGINDPNYVQVRTKKDRVLKGDIVIQLYKEDKDVLAPIKDKLVSELEAKYPNFRIMLFSNEFVHRGKYKSNIQPV